MSFSGIREEYFVCEKNVNGKLMVSNFTSLVTGIALQVKGKNPNLKMLLRRLPTVRRVKYAIYLHQMMGDFRNLPTNGLHFLPHIGEENSRFSITVVSRRYLNSTFVVVKQLPPFYIRYSHL